MPSMFIFCTSLDILIECYFKMSTDGLERDSEFRILVVEGILVPGSMPSVFGAFRGAKIVISLITTLLDTSKKLIRKRNRESTWYEVHDKPQQYSPHVFEPGMLEKMFPHHLSPYHWFMPPGSLVVYFIHRWRE